MLFDAVVIGLTSIVGAADYKTFLSMFMKDFISGVQPLQLKTHKGPI